jgi:hypothetical protein
VTIPTGAPEALSTEELVYIELTSTGNGSNCSGPFDIISHWPPYSSVNKNCDLLIRGISVSVSGQGQLVPFETKTLTFSTNQTCLYYLTESNRIMFNPTMSYQVLSDNEPIYDSYSDPYFSTSTLERVVQPFSISKGDKISFYNSGALGWDESYEYTVRDVTTTGSVNGAVTKDTRILATLDKAVNGNLLSSNATIDPMTNSKVQICRYIVWKHLPDETNVILKYNPKDSTLVENGLLFPQYIDEPVRKNAGNTIKALKAQNLI